MIEQDDRSRLMVEVKRAISRTLKVPVGTAPGGFQEAVARSFPVTVYKTGDLPPSFNGASAAVEADLGSLPFNQVVLVDNVRRATAGARSALDRLDALSLSEDARLRRDRIRALLDEVDQAVARDGGPIGIVVEPLINDLEYAVTGRYPSEGNRPDPEFGDITPFRQLLTGGGWEPPATPSETEQIDLVINLLDLAQRAIRQAWADFRRPGTPSAAASDRARSVLATIVVEKASDARGQFADLGVGKADSEAQVLPGQPDTADPKVTVDGFLDAAEDFGRDVPTSLAKLGHEAIAAIRARARTLQPLAQGAADSPALHNASRLRDTLRDLARALGELQREHPNPVIGDVSLVPWPDDRTATAVEGIRDGGLTVKPGPDPLGVTSTRAEPIYVHADDDDPLPVDLRNSTGETPAPPPPKATKTKESKVR